MLSLIYVGFEIRRSTLESDADIQAELLSYTVQRRYLIVESSDLATLLAKGYTDPTRLSPDEVLRFRSFIELFYVAWERAYMARTAGVFSEKRFDEWNNWFASVAQADPEFVWPMVRDSQGWYPPFVQHVNQSLHHPISEFGKD